MRVAMSQVIFQSVFGLSGRINRLSHPLYPPLGIGKRTILLGKAFGGQHHVGQTGGFGEENILDNQKIQVVEAGLGMIQIRIGNHGVLTDDVQGLDLAVMGLGSISVP